MKKLALAAVMLAQTSLAAPRDTFVLVHGALFSAVGWEPVATKLRDTGHNVVSFDVPGRRGDGLEPADVDLHVAVERLNKVVNAQPGNVILVGHSQGGALITQAVAEVGAKIKGLVYVSAVVPQSGETAFDGLTAETHKNFGATVTPDPSAKVFRLNPNKRVLEEAFFQDLRAKDPKLADFALASMVDEPLLIGNTPLSYPEDIFKALPKFYVETTRDQVVDLDNQRQYQSQTAMKKIYSIDAGHSPFLSQPEQVAEALVDVADTLRAAPDATTDEREVVASFYDAFLTGDFATVASLIADNVVWKQPGKSELSGIYQGKPAVLDLFARFGQLSQGTLRLEPRQIMQNSDEVVVIVTFSAHRNGIVLRGTGVDLFIVEGGQITEGMLFTDYQDSEDKFWSL